jgi:hypothetical protein
MSYFMHGNLTQKYTNIPESESRRHNEMRSTNNSAPRELVIYLGSYMNYKLHINMYIIHHGLLSRTIQYETIIIGTMTINIFMTERDHQ